MTLLRGLGAVLHTLCTALVARGWFRMREGGVGNLVGLSLGLWWWLRSIVNGLAKEGDSGGETVPRRVAVSPRLLAGWAFVCTLVIVPIGAALGGAWNQIIAVMAGGR